MPADAAAALLYGLPERTAGKDHIRNRENPQKRGQLNQNRRRPKKGAQRRRIPHEVQQEPRDLEGAERRGGQPEAGQRQENQNQRRQRQIPRAERGEGPFCRSHRQRERADSPAARRRVAVEHHRGHLEIEHDGEQQRRRQQQRGGGVKQETQ